MSQDTDCPGPRSWFGLKLHLRSDRPWPSRRIDLHLFDGGYAGVGPVEHDRLNLGMLVSVTALRACGGSPDRLLAERLTTNPLLRAAIHGARPCGPWKSVGPLRFGRRCSTSAGALFLGDAAGTVDPFCGEGMANALCGAELALPFALRAAELGHLDNATAREYDRKWIRAFGPATRRARRIGRLLERPALACWVLAALAGPGRAFTARLVAATRTDWNG